MARQGKKTGSTARITKRAIDDLRSRAKSAKRTLYLRDDELKGFGAVATKLGACSYFVEYRLGGRGTTQKRMTVGKHGALTPDEARKRAKDELGKVARGDDVAQERKDERAKLVAGTFRDLSESWFATEGKRPRTGEWKSRRWKEVHAMIEKSVYSILGSKAPDAIAKAELAGLINKTKAHSHSTARRMHETLRPLFKWAFGQGAIQSNPMDGLTCPKPETPRDRVLDDTEVKALWQAASEENWPFSSVFKVLLLTGQRKNEVAGMRWREVDLDAGAWTIAKERCKNGKAHTVDLHPEAVRLLDPLGDAAAPRLMKNTEKEDLVYSTTGRTPVSGFSKVKARVDARMKEILGDKFQPWRIHDLRRTTASGMAVLGFQPHVIERVLNHVSGAQGGLVSVYQRHEYRDERKRAILAWGDHVMGLVSARDMPSNVVPLRVA
jgi:integrase